MIPVASVLEMNWRRIEVKKKKSRNFLRDFGLSHGIGMDSVSIGKLREIA